MGTSGRSRLGVFQRYYDRIRGVSRQPRRRLTRPESRRLAIEPLEGRALLSISVHYQFANVDVVAGVAQPGTPISPSGSLVAGQDFFLQAFIKDDRPNPTGVYQAFLDVGYNSSLVSTSVSVPAAAPIVHGPDYNDSALESGHFATSPARIEDVGSRKSPLSAPIPADAEFLLFSVELHASAVGSLALTTDPSASAGHGILLWFNSGSLTKSDIDVSGASISIVPVANQAPSVVVTTPTSPQSGNVSIGYSLTDAESNTCSIAVQYSGNGGMTWQTATAGSGGDGTTALTSSPTGQSHTFIWASGSDNAILSPPNSNVEVRIIPTDSATGTAGTSGPFTVNSAVTLSPATLPAGTVNVAYSQAITAGGGTGAKTLTVSNIQNAVAGLIVPGSGSNTLSISGTPTATGTETFTVTATDSLGATTVGNYSITVNSAVTLSPATLPAGTVNVAYSQAITAGGGTGAKTLTVSNIQNAVAGLVVPGSGSNTLSISGTPTATGTETFTVRPRIPSVPRRSATTASP